MVERTSCRIAEVVKAFNHLQGEGSGSVRSRVWDDQGVSKGKAAGLSGVVSGVTKVIKGKAAGPSGVVSGVIKASPMGRQRVRHESCRG